MTKKEIIEMLVEEAKDYGSFSEFAGELGWDERWMPDYAEKWLERNGGDFDIDSDTELPLQLDKELDALVAIAYEIAHEE